MFLFVLHYFIFFIKVEVKLSKNLTIEYILKILFYIKSKSKKCLFYYFNHSIITYLSFKIYFI